LALVGKKIFKPFFKGERKPGGFKGPSMAKNIPGKKRKNIIFGEANPNTL